MFITSVLYLIVNKIQDGVAQNVFKKGFINTIKQIIITL